MSANFKTIQSSSATTNFLIRQFWHFVDGRIICHPYHEQCIFHCTSTGISKEFIGLLKKVPNSHCEEVVNNKGILVHILSSENILNKRKPKQMLTYISKRTKRIENEVFYVSTSDWQSTSGMLYVVNNNVVVTLDNAQESLRNPK
jgi:hypothetical protein